MKQEILISLCMIVKNEEHCIYRCLNSVKDFADEIIIVDTGSTDNTKNIACQFTEKIYDFKWVNDFSKARNFAFSKANGRYLFWLDADDYISEDNFLKLKDLKKNLDHSIDVYMLKYEIAFDKAGNSTFTYYRERLLKNDGSFCFLGAVHEAVVPHGKIEYLDISIKHLKDRASDPKRNLKIYEELKKYKFLDERELYYYGRELFYNKKYKQAISQLNKVINNNSSWVENILGALEIKADCQLALKKYDLALETLYKSFSFSYPRANFLCRIGDIFMIQNKFNQAIFWYLNALNCEKNYISGGFILEDYYCFYPALQLCVAYYYLGNLKKSEEFNNLALSYKPYDETALKNKDFFGFINN